MVEGGAALHFRSVWAAETVAIDLEGGQTGQAWSREWLMVGPSRSMCSDSSAARAARFGHCRNRLGYQLWLSQLWFSTSYQYSSEKVSIIAGPKVGRLVVWHVVGHVVGQVGEMGISDSNPMDSFLS